MSVLKIEIKRGAVSFFAVIGKRNHFTKLAVKTHIPQVEKHQGKDRES
ncbi:MAG: hypothetical protein RLZZ143_573 [Cyanobacteriota bacterium]|jgi:hypothetical protein